MVRIRVLVVALACLALVGCGSSSGGTGSPTAAASTPTTAPSAAASAATPAPGASGQVSLKMTLPSTWSVVDMNLAALQGMITTMGTSNPQLVNLINQLITSGAYKQLDLFAYEYSGLTIIGNVDTTFGVALHGSDLDAVAPALEGEIQQAGATNVSTQHVTLPLGDVLLVSYDLNLTLPTGGTLLQSGRAYYYASDGVMYAATFTCANPATTTCLADSAAIAQTLTLAP